ncbi:MAG TPA: hypothetical protein EYQ42_03220 [Thiotrichaceae bacterium]|jgi:hypothetical protein|nr:hypothetical protein [Thiotrichaceae bacterium]HIM08536.1 hypothetical protein [Gammaproteobacteria bacterium]
MPESQLTAEASIAYQSFQKMRESKQVYFTFLQEIDVKYKSDGEATSTETEELGELLAAHDKNVAAFNEAMNAVEDFEARDALIKLMS